MKCGMPYCGIEKTHALRHAWVDKKNKGYAFQQRVLLQRAYAREAVYRVKHFAYSDQLCCEHCRSKYRPDRNREFVRLDAPEPGVQWIIANGKTPHQLREMFRQLCEVAQ